MAGKPVCKYGANCYRKNAEHLHNFFHPSTANESPSLSGHEDLEQSSESPPVAKRAKKDDDEMATHTKTIVTAGSVDIKHTEQNIRRSSAIIKIGPLLYFVLLALAESSNDGSPTGIQDPCRNVKEQFLVDMPKDFTLFWDFCKKLNPSHPELALMPTLNLKLVGPFHVLGGLLTGVPWQQCVLHYRYFYDPPEFVTVLCSDDDKGFHLGYFRDDPKSVNCLVASNCANVGCEFRIEGSNLFSAVRYLLKNSLQDRSIDKTKQQELEHIESLVNKEGKAAHLDMQEPKGLMASRNRTINAKCFHKIGISVPFDKSTEVGYRSLSVTDGELKKILDRITGCTVESKRSSLMEPLQEIVTYVQFANDECDYGMGLELGLDLFMHGDQFHSLVLSLLPLAYELLCRDEYSRIIKEHIHHRGRTPLNFCSTCKAV